MCTCVQYSSSTRRRKRRGEGDDDKKALGSKREIHFLSVKSMFLKA